MQERMLNNYRGSDDGRKLILELFAGSVIVIGLVLIVTSFFLPIRVQDVIRGIGLSLFPSGLVAFLIYNFAARITDILLTDTIRKSLEACLRGGMENIESAIRKELREVDKDMRSLSPLFASATRLGLENLHLTRSEALGYFAMFLDAEIQRARGGESAWIWFVCSSIKGFLETASTSFEGGSMMERIVESGCNLRILMTDPAIADLRAKQEGRGAGDIPKEINMNLVRLKRRGVKREWVKFYEGTPTVFAIATDNKMLLNPYPYQTEAFKCFTLTVHKTTDPKINDIYHQYLRYHFEEPWEHASEVPPALWDSL